MTDILHAVFKKVVCAMLLIYAFNIINASASNDVMSIKYGYGKNRLGNINPSYSPVVYPLNESAAYQELLEEKPDASIRQLYPYYSISDAENKEAKSKYKIDVTLSVWQDKNNIFGLVRFYNKSKHDYFVHMDYLPKYGGLCDGAFLITTENIRLDYLGMRCQFQGASRIYDTKEDRKKLKAGKKYSFLVVLNRSYEFLPGRHQYNIGSLGYSLVNENWFLENSMYTKMFTILDKKPICSTVTDLPRVIEERWLCPQYHTSTDDLEYILRGFGIDGGSRKGFFEIRTNQVVEMINGNDDTSYINILKKHRP